MISASCSTSAYSGLACSWCQTRWWASSTTSRSQSAANRASWALLVLAQPLQGHQGQLGVLEGIAGIALGEALAVEQGDLQVEAPAHLHQPLVLEVFRDQDQHAAGAAGEQLAMDDQAGLDGLAQAHFVGQQDARRHAVGDFAGDVQLVGDGLGAGAAQAPQRGLEQAGAVFESVVAQGEPGQRVDLPGEQTVAGQAELDEVRELGFRQGALLVLRGEAVVDQQAFALLDLADGHLPAFEVGDLIARGEAHAGQRRIAHGVLAGIAGGRIEHGEQAAILGQDGPQAQFRFTVADPALPRLILRHVHLPKKPGMVPQRVALSDAGDGLRVAPRLRRRAVRRYGRRQVPDFTADSSRIEQSVARRAQVSSAAADSLTRGLPTELRRRSIPMLPLVPTHFA